MGHSPPTCQRINHLQSNPTCSCHTTLTIFAGFVAFPAVLPRGERWLCKSRLFKYERNHPRTMDVAALQRVACGTTGSLAGCGCLVSYYWAVATVGTVELCGLQQHPGLSAHTQTH